MARTVGEKLVHWLRQLSFGKAGVVAGRALLSEAGAVSTVSIQ